MSNNNRKNLSVCFIIFALLFSCNRRSPEVNSLDDADSNANQVDEKYLELDIDNNNTNAWHITHGFPILIEYDVEFPNAMRLEENMVSNVIFEYAPENRGIINIDDIDNTRIIEVFDRPALNKTIELSSYIGEKGPIFNNITELLLLFEIILPPEDVEIINNTTFSQELNRIKVESLTIYFTRILRSSELQRLFIIEYDSNSDIFDWNIKIGSSRDEITKRFGEPSGYSIDRTIYIFESFSTARQINIIFNNDNVVKVQLIAFYSL